MGASFWHGYRLLPGVEAPEFFERFRGPALELAGRLTGSRLAYLAQATSDDRFLGRNVESILDPIEVAIEHMKSRYDQCQATKRREPEDDVQCEASYVEHEGRTYILVHAEMSAYHDLLAETEGVEPWPWYDADDVPDGLSRDDWDSRRETWYEIMRTNSWSMPGVFRLLDQLPTVSTAEIASALPSLNRRARRLALSNVIAKHCTSSPTGIDATIAAVIETTSWIRDTQEGQAALTAEIEALETRLAQAPLGATSADEQLTPG